MSDWAKELIENTAQKEKITEDDIMLIFNKNKKDFIIAEKSYREQRQTLDYVCSEIQKEFSDQYKSIDDVFKEFLKANFTGQLLTIGRLVEETFGKGSSRILGDMGMDSKSAILTLEILKIIRAKKTIKKFR